MRSGERVQIDPRVNMVLDRIKLSLDHYSERRDDWRRYFELYMAYRSEPDYPWTSNLMLPVSFDVIETFLPHLVSDDFVMRAVAGQGSDVANTGSWDALMEYNSRQMKLAWKMVGIEKQALLYGWSPFMVDWLFDVKLMNVRKFEKINVGTPFEISRPQVVKTPVVRYDGPSLKSLDIFNVFLQPGKAQINGDPGERSEWCGIRFEVPYKWLLMRSDLMVGETPEEQREVLRKLAQTNFPEHNPDTDMEREERQSLLGLDPTQFDSTVQRVEVIAMFGDRGPNELEDGVIWIGNREVVLRDEGSPLWHGDIPIGIINDIPLPHDACGIGEVQVAEIFQLEKSDIRNARLDNMHQLVNRMWKVKTGMGIDDREMISRPGGRVHMDDLDAVAPLVQQDQFFSTYKEEELLDEDVQRTLGALDVLRGMMDINRTTATGNQILSEFAAARVRIKAICMKHQGLMQIGRWMIDLEQQFTTHEKLVRIHSGGLAEDITIRPEDIAGHWDIMPLMDQSLPATKAQKRDDAMTRMTTLAPFAEVAVVLDALILDFLDAFNVPNPQKFLVSSQQRAAAAADPQQLARDALDQVVPPKPQASGAPLATPETVN